MQVLLSFIHILQLEKLFELNLQTKRFIILIALLCVIKDGGEHEDIRYD